MSEPRVRAAFVGAGKQANWRHYPSICSLPDVELAAICDLDAAKAAETAQRWGVPKTYQDLGRMLDEVDPQVVYVVMGPELVFRPAVQVLQRGKHLFIEKPPGINLNQVRVLAHYAAEHGCLSQVGYQRRFVPAMTELKARVEARGPIHSLAVANLKATRDLTRIAGPGVLDQLAADGGHAVDTLRWLGGGEVTRVTSSVRTLYQAGPVANAVLAQVEFAGGAVGQLHYSMVTGGSAAKPGATAAGIFRAEIHGPNITAYVDADRQSWISADDGEPEFFDSPSFGAALGGQPEHWLGFWHQHRHFIDCVKAGVQPSINLAEAVKTAELIERIYAAALHPQA